MENGTDFVAGERRLETGIHMRAPHANGHPGLSRRGFLVGAAGALAGCKMMPFARASRRVSADYLRAPVDRTWLFPDVRRDCVFLADAPGGMGLDLLGKTVLDAGWMGVGILVVPQVAGERPDLPSEDWAGFEEDLKRRLSESAEAGVVYWKVTSGVHCRDIRYLRLMRELRDRYAPDLLIDNCLDAENLLNGKPFPLAGWRPPLLPDITGGGRCRMTDNPLYDGLGRECGGLAEVSDVLSTGDTLFPMCAATALDRAVFAVECADRLGARAVVSAGDEPLLAAVLGLEFATGRALSPTRSGEGLPWNRDARMAEASRCVNWHRLAPPFGSDRGIRLVRGMGRLEENWQFGRGVSGWKAVDGQEIRQTAPAVVARGLPPPEVRSMEPGGDVPFVVAGGNPCGAKSVAAIPRLTQERGFHTPRASVFLDAGLERGEPLGVFGELGELTVTVADSRPARVTVCDLAGGSPEDVTAHAEFGGGRIALPGDVLRRAGTQQNPEGDASSPGLVLEVG